MKSCSIRKKKKKKKKKDLESEGLGAMKEGRTQVLRVILCKEGADLVTNEVWSSLVCLVSSLKEINQMFSLHKLLVQ